MRTHVKRRLIEVSNEEVRFCRICDDQGQSMPGPSWIGCSRIVPRPNEPKEVAGKRRAKQSIGFIHEPNDRTLQFLKKGPYEIVQVHVRAEHIFPLVGKIKFEVKLPCDCRRQEVVESLFIRKLS